MEWGNTERTPCSWKLAARDFKEFIRVAGLSHVRTAPDYPQSNGKIERWHRSLKSDCLRPGTPPCPAPLLPHPLLPFDAEPLQPRHTLCSSLPYLVSSIRLGAFIVCVPNVIVHTALRTTLRLPFVLQSLAVSLLLVSQLAILIRRIEQNVGFFQLSYATADALRRLRLAFEFTA